MADFTQTVDIVFGVIDNASAKLTGLSTSAAGFTQNIEQATQPLADFTGNLIKFELAVAAAGVALVGFALKSAVDTESALTELGKITGDTSAELREAFGPGFKDTAVTYATSLDEVIRSTADFRQAGFDAAEAAVLLEGALQAAATTELDAAQASQLLVQLVRGFGSSAVEAAGQLDVLNEISNNAAITAGTLGQSMAVLGPVTQDLGFSFNETAAFLTPVLEKFQDGQRSARGLQVALLNLATQGTKEVQEEFARLGVATRDANGDLLSGKEILQNLVPVYASLTDTQRISTAEVIAGASQTGRFNALMQGLTGTLGETARQTEILTVANNSAGSMMREFGNFAESTEFKLKQLGVAVGVVSTEIGDKLLDSFRGAILGSSELVDAIRKALASGQFDPLFGPIQAGFENFQGLLEGIAIALPEALKGVDFTPILNSLDALGGSLGSIFDGLDLTNAEDLTVAIQKIIDLGAGLIDATSGIVDAFVPFIGAIVDLATKFGELDSDTQQLIGQILGFGTVLNIVAGGLAPLIIAFGGLSNVFGGIFTIGSKLVGSAGLLGLLGKAFTVISGTILPVVGVIATLGTGLGFLIDAVFPKATAGANDFFGGLFSKGDSLGTLAFDLLNPTADAIENVGVAAKEAAPEVKKVVEEVAKLVPEAEKAKVVQAALAGNTELLQRVFEKAAIAVGKSSESYQVFADGAVVPLGEAIDDLNLKIGATGPLAKSVTETWEDYIKRLNEAGVSSADLSSQTTKIVDSQGKQIDITTKLVDGVTEYSGHQKVLAEDAKKVAEETDKEVSAAEKWRLKLLEIDADERIKAIEASVTLNIAQLEEETKRLEKAFDSIDNTVQSTGDVISGVFGAFGDVTGFFGLEKLELIEQQLEKENEHRQTALDKQNELIDAQIKLLEVKADQLEAGNALITISGDGLEPELEAFMFKILKKIQLKANAEGAEFLLGLTA